MVAFPCKTEDSENSPWPGDLSILNEYANAATEVQRLARASDDGNRGRTELPHDLLTGCPNRGQATKTVCRGTRIWPGTKPGKKPGKTVRPRTMTCPGATIWPGKKTCPAR